MLRNLLHGNPQITSMDDLLNSLNERSERSKATKLWSDTLIKGLFIMTAFVRGANEQEFPLLQLAAVFKSCASYCAATLFCRGWLSHLPRIGSFFIHNTESFISNVWKSLIIMTVAFVSSLGSTTPFSRNSSLSQHTCVLVMNQEERPALLLNVQMTNWALSCAVCGEVSSSLNTMSQNVLPTAKGQKKESAKGISDIHPHGKLLNILQHVKWHMETYALEFGQTMVNGLGRSSIQVVMIRSQSRWRLSYYVSKCCMIRKWSMTEW